MDQSKKPKTSDESSASSSSRHNLRAEKMVKVVNKEEEQVSSSKKIQKSDREKIRRDKLNEQFLLLGNALDPNRPKSDKALILTDTIKMLKDLMTQVDKLKAEYATLSQESLELIQEKSELREEKTSLKSDIEILNAEYQDRVRRSMVVPWIPHYTCHIPLVAPILIPPQLQQFPLYGTQDPNPCSTFVPYSASVNLVNEQASVKHSSCSSSSGDSNKQDSKSKSFDLNLIRNGDHLDHKYDVGLELELKIHASSSAQRDVSGKENNGGSSTTTSSSSNSYSSSQAVQGSSPGSLNNILKS